MGGIALWKIIYLEVICVVIDRLGLDSGGDYDLVYNSLIVEQKSLHTLVLTWERYSRLTATNVSR